MAKRGPSKSVHFAGGLTYKLRDGRTAKIYPGYAACCSGERATKIRRDGNHTTDRLWITCLRCLRMIERAEKLAEDPSRPEDFKPVAKEQLPW